MSNKTIDLTQEEISVNDLLRLLVNDDVVILEKGNVRYQVRAKYLRKNEPSESESDWIPLKNGDVLLVQLEVKELRPLRLRRREVEQSETNLLLKKGRVAELHAGTAWVSDDFDDPLPDEFWLGES